jgi:hypothetical protein
MLLSQSRLQRPSRAGRTHVIQSASELRLSGYRTKSNDHATLIAAHRIFFERIATQPL